MLLIVDHDEPPPKRPRLHRRAHHPNTSVYQSVALDENVVEVEEQACAKAKEKKKEEQGGWTTETEIPKDAKTHDPSGIIFSSSESLDWLTRQYKNKWVDFFPFLSEMPTNWPSPPISLEKPEGEEQFKVDLNAFTPLYWASPEYIGRRNKNGYLEDNSN
ncbi:hypothetical protein BJ912DRAFT_1068850 [Pholiota molesta]|nr:hypothetical protein BJ912DRAFT_1068850 [Pholiota molesta]